MGPADVASRCDHDRATKLGGVTDRPPLYDPAAYAGEHPLGHNARVEQIGDSAHLRPDRLVADALLIRQHRYIDSEPAAEMRGVTRSGLSDQHETRAGGPELVLGAVQLHGVRTTVRSPVMPEPHQRDRPLPPEIAKTDIVSLVVG